MDRNTIIGFVMIAVILIGWSYFTAPSKEEIKAMQEKQDSLRHVQNVKDSLAAIQLQNTVDTNVVAADTLQEKTKESDAPELNSFAAASTGDESFTTIENEYLKITLSNKGAAIHAVELKNYKTYSGKPLILFEGDTNKFALKFYAGNVPVNTQNLFFTPQNVSENSLSVTGNDSVSFAFRLFNSYKNNDSLIVNENAYIEYTYTLKGNSYVLGFNIGFKGMQNVIAQNTPKLDFDFSNVAPSQEKSIENERNASTVYYKYLLDEVDYLSETKDGKESLNNKVKWIGLKQQFFTSVIIAETNFLNADIETITDKNDSNHVKTLSTTVGIEMSNPADFNAPLAFYFGPNHFNTLKEYGMQLEAQIPLGWGIFGWINRFAVIPVFNFLNGFNMNYGIIILILTLLIKLILFPIAYKTYSSSAKMRILKPDIEEINAKFPKKEEALKKQQATMALYKKAGVNPMAGCLPMLLQLPVLIAMFRFFPASIELRQEAFLWADDLSSYDSILDLPFNIPFYGAHVSLFTLLMTITTIIYTKFNNDMMGSTNQMPGMKTMMYIMPVMFLGIFNNFSAALSYYYFLTNIITFLQMFIFRFIVDEAALKRKIEANKNRKTTPKKSGFQARLEEMAKKRGYKMPGK